MIITELQNGLNLYDGARHNENLTPQLLFQVGVNRAFVVTKDVFAFGVGNDVIRVNRYLAAAAGRVDNVGRHAVTGSMPAEFLDYVDTGVDRGAEMLRTSDKIALVNIIRPHAHLQKLVHQFFHDERPVVDAFEQNSLAAKRYPGICQHLAGDPRAFGDLFGVVEM